MKVFKVWADRYTYDDYDSFVIVANSKEEILEHLRPEGSWRRSFCFGEFSEGQEVWFGESQGEIHIEEVNLNVEKPYIVCASYNAG